MKKTIFKIRIDIKKTYPSEVSQEEIKQRFYEFLEGDLGYAVEGIDFIEYDVVDK